MLYSVLKGARGAAAIEEREREGLVKITSFAQTLNASVRFRLHCPFLPFSVYRLSSLFNLCLCLYLSVFLGVKGGLFCLLYGFNFEFQNEGGDFLVWGNLGFSLQLLLML